MGGTGGRYPEGPHLYKINGLYYLLISEGGTEYGHQVVIARSTNPYGPFHPNPNNPILTHINKNAASNPIQGTGHADLVQAHDNSWWMVFLAFRPIGRHHHIGRETFLAPVSWTTNNWPLVNITGSVDINMNISTLPQFKNKTESERENFDQPSLSLRWNYIRNPKTQNYSLNDRKGWLCLNADIGNLNDSHNITFTGFRQKHHTFTALTLLDFSPEKKAEAGFSVYHKSNGHYDVYIMKKGNERYITLRYILGNITHIESQYKLEKNTKVYIKVEGTPSQYKFFFSENGKTYTRMGSADAKFLSTETLGGFVGVFLGLYSTTNGDKLNSKAYFNWMEYKGEK